MKLSEEVLAWVRSLLVVEPSRWEDVLARFETALGPAWSMRELERPGTNAIGVRLRDGRALPLAQWRELLGLEASVEARVVDLGTFSAEGLPEHMAAGFANTHAQCLAVRARGVPSVYALERVDSSPFLITPARWVEFLRAQPHRERVLESQAEGISEFNEQEQQGAPVAAGQVESYLLSAEGRAAFSSLGGTLLFRLQQALRREGAREHVPEDFRPFFRTHDVDGVERQMMEEERRHEFIPGARVLSLSPEASAGDFVALVDAQPFSAKIWERVVETLNRRYGRPPVDASGAREQLLHHPEDSWGLYERELMWQWQGVCQGHGVEPLIPEAQRGLVRSVREEQLAEDKGFIPPEEELHQVETEESSVVMLLCELDEVPPGLFAAVAPPDAEREAFLAALREAQTFGESVDSPFSEAFKIARFVLETEAFRLSAEPLTGERVAVLRGVVGEAGFSERAQEIWVRKVGLLLPFEPFQPSEERLRGLLACALVDVFGGMGSWNDMYFEPKEVHATYERVSAQLHSARQAFSAAMLNAR